MARNQAVASPATTCMFIGDYAVYPILTALNGGSRFFTTVYENQAF